MFLIPIGNEKFQGRDDLLERPETTQCRKRSKSIDYFGLTIRILVVPKFLAVMGTEQFFLGPPPLLSLI